MNALLALTFVMIMPSAKIPRDLTLVAAKLGTQEMEKHAQVKRLLFKGMINLHN